MKYTIKTNRYGIIMWQMVTGIDSVYRVTIMYSSLSIYRQYRGNPHIKTTKDCHQWYLTKFQELLTLLKHPSSRRFLVHGLVFNLSFVCYIVFCGWLFFYPSSPRFLVHGLVFNLSFVCYIVFCGWLFFYPSSPRFLVHGQVFNLSFVCYIVFCGWLFWFLFLL